MAFSPSSKGFDPLTDIPNLRGKVIIVTGGNGGIGYSTIQHLARKGAKVYVSKALSGIETLKLEGLKPGNEKIFILGVDLSNPGQVKGAT